MKRSLRTIAAFGVAAALAVGASGCAADKQITIAFVMGAESDPFFQAMKVGAEAEAKAEGGKPEDEGGRSGDEGRHEGEEGREAGLHGGKRTLPLPARLASPGLATLTSSPGARSTRPRRRRTPPC